MAVHPVLSLIGTLRRFYEMRDRGTVPRATAVEAHDRVVAVLPDNLDILRLDTSISRITLWNRDGQRLYDSAVDPGLPSEALRRQWNRPWSRKELQAVQRQISELRQKEEATSSGQAEAIRELERRAKRVPLRNRSRDR